MNRVSVVACVAVVVVVCACENSPPPDGEGEGEAGEGEGEGEEGEGELGGEGEGEGDVGGEGEGEGEGGCDLPASITTAIVIAASCSPLAVDHDVDVTPTGSLTFEPGLTVQFDDGFVLLVRGAFIAAGTAALPIVIESGETRASGAWRGVSVLAGTTEAVFEHVTIRHGGGADTDLIPGCLKTSPLLPDTMTVTSSTFEDCANNCFTSLSSAPYIAFDDNTFARCPTAIEAHGNSVGSMSGNQTFIDAPRLHARTAFITESQTWVAQDLPWELSGSLIVVDGTVQPVLTLEAQTLVFGAGSGVSVGGKNGGSLVANGVTFQALVPGTAWQSITFGPQTGTSTLTGVTVSGATTGATLRQTESAVSVTGSTFSGNGADIFVGCGSTPLLENNTAVVTTETGC